MSRLRIIRDGAYFWLDEGPSNGANGPARVSGSLLVGESGSVARERNQYASRSIAGLKNRQKDPPKRSSRAIYATDEERIEARRRAFRESKKRARERAKCDNPHTGRSGESNSMAPDARLPATTRKAGVAASIEVVAR